MQDQHYFRSNECHKLKELGWSEYICWSLKTQRAENFIKNKEYFNGLYVMGMVDYLCRLHDLPLYEGYHSYRNKIGLKNTAYPVSYDIAPHYIKEKMIKNAIPEFARFNIIEGDVFDVC